MAYTGNTIDLSDRIKDICVPLVRHPEDLHVELVGEEKKAQSYRVTCRDTDMGKLLGRSGTVSDSIRTLVNIALRPYKRKASIKFAPNPSEKTN